MTNSALGQKIKYFRTRAGMSQMDLEIAIGASPGSLSRIENGKVNPTKETIVDIAMQLKLDTPEIASLFGIDIKDTTGLISTLNAIHQAPSITELINLVVNDLVFKLGYLASVLFLVEGNLVYSRGQTHSNISQKVINSLTQPFTSLNFPLSATSNYTVKAILSKKPQLTHFTRDYVVPAVSEELADQMKIATGDKSNLVVPLVADDKALGAIVYIKKLRSDFEAEQGLLIEISKYIAQAILQAN